MPLHSENVGGIRIIIETDTDPLNPRVDYDNAAAMICFHPRYDLGDVEASKSYTGIVDLIAHLAGSDFHEKYKTPADAFDAQDGLVWLPLFLYDHSGLTMNTTGFSCPWDTSQVGIIYMDKHTVCKEYGALSDETKERAKKLLVSEVETYDHYLRGNVYCTSYYKDQGDDHDYGDEEALESFGGFIGDLDDCIKQAKEEASGYETE